MAFHRALPRVQVTFVSSFWWDPCQTKKYFSWVITTYMIIKYVRIHTLRCGATFMTLILILFLNGIMTMPKLKKIGWCYFCRIISTEVLIWLLNFNLVLFCIWSLYDHQHHASQLERGFLFAILINGLFWAAFCFDDTLMWKKWMFFVQLELFLHQTWIPTYFLHVHTQMTE